METNTLKSLYPQHEKRSVSLGYIIDSLAEALDHTRRTSESFEGVIERLFQTLQIELPAEHELGALAEELMILIQEDNIYDSEFAMAARASKIVFQPIFGDTIEASGWFAGSKVSIAGDIYQLTGQSCEKCGGSPQAYGLGGGVRCVDVESCGYVFCL